MRARPGASPPCPTLDVERAAALLADGAVVACPTEGVWGLACLASNVAAVERIVALKARDAAKGLILIGKDRPALQPLLAPLEPAWRSRMDVAWPGPVTFVVPAARDASAMLTGGRTTLAVRVSAHPTLAALAATLGGPLVSTSANVSGAPPLKTPTAIRRAFGDALAGIVEGELGGRRGPSDIVDVRTGARLR